MLLGKELDLMACVNHNRLSRLDVSIVRGLNSRDRARGGVIAGRLRKAVAADLGDARTVAWFCSGEAEAIVRAADGRAHPSSHVDKLHLIADTMHAR